MKCIGERLGLLVIGLCLTGAVCLTLGACKVRDADSAGLLDTPRQGELSGGERYQLHCMSSEGESYTWELSGVSPRSPDVQALRMSLSRSVGMNHESLLAGVDGRGFVQTRGSIFVESDGGVLTAEYASALERTSPGYTHHGVMSLGHTAGDHIEAGLVVVCRLD